MKATALAVIALSALAAGCTTTTPSFVTQADSADFEALKQKLTGDARFARLTTVAVDPTRGVVKLAGEVSSEEDRAYAGRLASSVRGVEVVYNEIQVHGPRR
jgi:osmotically-inducible protein OsmY